MPCDRRTKAEGINQMQMPLQRQFKLHCSVQGVLCLLWYRAFRLLALVETPQTRRRYLHVHLCWLAWQCPVIQLLANSRLQAEFRNACWPRCLLQATLAL